MPRYQYGRRPDSRPLHSSTALEPLEKETGLKFFKVLGKRRNVHVKEIKRILWLSVALVIFVLPAIALVSVRTSQTTSLAKKHHGPKAAIFEESGESSRGQARQPIEGEIIAITPNGFAPKAIIRPSGPFLLVVDNQSSLPNFTLLLSADIGLPLRNVVVQREKRLWSDIVDLPPGNYKLGEATHPDWVCEITIRQEPVNLAARCWFAIDVKA